MTKVAIAAGTGATAMMIATKIVTKIAMKIAMTAAMMGGAMVIVSSAIMMNPFTAKPVSGAEMMAVHTAVAVMALPVC